MARAFQGLSIGPWRYFDRVGSTNDEAARWAEGGAPHLALVLADEQYAGRGRLDRQWFTPPGAALALSLVLRPGSEDRLAPERIPFYTALGALALSGALRRQLGLEPAIKWPNDVLLNGRKTAGILAEAQWQGDQIQAVILGIGVNIRPASVPPDDQVVFPATCVEQAAGQPVDRLALLRTLLEELLGWLPRLGSEEFRQAWDSSLAYKGEKVQVWGLDPDQPAILQVIGLDPTGGLVVLDEQGRELTLHSGELRIRPAG